jgi:hypothetical protein
VRWYQSLTRNQRLILLSLTLALTVVIALFAWSVWSTVQAVAQDPDALDAVDPEQAAFATDDVASRLTPTALLQAGNPLPATATPSPLPPALPTPVPTFDVFRAGVIAANVADARESRTRWGTPLTLVDRTGLARVFHNHYQVRSPLVLRMQPVLEALNLWVCDAGSADCRVRVDVVTQAKEVAAFYVPEMAELYLRRDWDGPTSTLEHHLAYAYARALPDQFSDISALMAEATSLDLQIALAAVAEGEALVSVWLLNGTVPSDHSASSSQADALRTQIVPAVCPSWQSSEPWLEELSCLTFDLGVRFVTAQYLEGGVDALDEIVLRPPRSTEQLLHPERYTAPDEPVAVPPLEPGLGRDWQLHTTETLGEALIRWILTAWQPAGEHQAGETGAALDWGGDLLQVWRTADDAWVAAWQIDLDDARAAVRVYGQLLDLMPGPLLTARVTGTIPPASLRGGRWWTNEDGAVFLHRRAERLRLVWGSDADAVERVGATDLQ